MTDWLSRRDLCPSWGGGCCETEEEAMKKARHERTCGNFDSKAVQNICTRQNIRLSFYPTYLRLPVVRRSTTARKYQFIQCIIMLSTLVRLDRLTIVRDIIHSESSVEAAIRSNDAIDNDTTDLPNPSVPRVRTASKLRQYGPTPNTKHTHPPPPKHNHTSCTRLQSSVTGTQVSTRPWRHDATYCDNGRSRRP